MTKKDYELIAQAIRDSAARDPHPAETAAREWLVTCLAARLRAANARFDSDRFINACGILHSVLK